MSWRARSLAQNAIPSLVRSIGQVNSVPVEVGSRLPLCCTKEKWMPERERERERERAILWEHDHLM